MRRLAISFVFLLLTLGFLYLLFALQITSQSKIAGYTLKVDRFGFAQFLIKSGYYSGEGLWKVAGVTLTGERQRFMTITKDVSLPPFQSASIKNDQKRMEILAHYEGSVLEEILSYGNDGQKGINLTLLTYVCVAQSKTKTGLLDRESCYQMAESYLEKNPGTIFKLERESAKTGLRLVRTARAASCYGLVECEPLTTVCTCSFGGAACSSAGARCGPYSAGTCNCSSSCSGSGGGAMDYYYCSEQTTRSSCEGQTGAEAYCKSKGLCAVPGGCYWDSSGPIPTPTPAPPPPPPGPTPTPAPTGMTMHVTIGLDKNRNGIFDDGYYQVIEDPVDTNCGTFPNISGLTVSYSGAATGVIDYHTNCAGGTYNYPYSAKGILATGNFTFTLNNLPSNYSLKWIEEGTGKCTLSGGVVTCTGLANGQTYSLWFFIQESGVANCKNLTGPSTLYVGETGTFTATYEAGTGPITDRGLAIYREGQCEPNTPAYWNKIAGAAGTQSFSWVPSSPGTYDVDCRAWNDGITECRGRCFGPPPYQCAGPTTTRKVTVLSPISAWWQVKDSDLLAFGDLDSSVPTSLYFNLVGGGGFPGVPVYSGSTNLTSTNVSVKKWLAKTYFSSKIFNFGSSYFINSIPSAATINNISSSAVPGSYFASGGTAYNGYYWYVYDGNANGGFNLTITSAAALGSRKVILIVKNAGLNVQGNINLTKGSGFFLAVTTGNIVVTPNVGGGASANLEGIYVADGTFFSTKWGDKNDERLWVRGTVAAYGGIDLQRNLGSTNNSLNSAEFFEYAPELELLFPIELSNRLTNWREVAP